MTVGKGLGASGKRKKEKGKSKKGEVGRRCGVEGKGRGNGEGSDLLPLASSLSPGCGRLSRPGSWTWEVEGENEEQC